LASRCYSIEWGGGGGALVFDIKHRLLSLCERTTGLLRTSRLYCYYFAIVDLWIAGIQSKQLKATPLYSLSYSDIILQGAQYSSCVSCYCRFWLHHVVITQYLLFSFIILSCWLKEYRTHSIAMSKTNLGTRYIYSCIRYVDMVCTVWR